MSVVPWNKSNNLFAIKERRLKFYVSILKATKIIFQNIHTIKYKCKDVFKIVKVIYNLQWLFISPLFHGTRLLLNIGG